MKKIKPITIIIIVLFLSSFKRDFGEPRTMNNFTQNDTTTYSYEGLNYGLKLKLIANEKFVYEFYIRGCTGGGESEKVTGTYIRDKFRITLKPDSIYFSILPFNNTETHQNFKLRYGVDSLRIKTIYNIINWGNTIYLVSPEKDSSFRSHPVIALIDFDIKSVLDERNDYHAFADFFNSGLEPESHGRYLTRETDTMNKSNYPEFDISQILDEWKWLFLTKPVEATIIKASTERRKYDNVYHTVNKVILNKGKRDNIRIGIEFFDKSKTKYIKIIDIEEDKCTGVTQDDFSKDEIVSTNWGN